MATLKQLEANRRNSQLSTGPRTDAGKQTSRMNALKTGVHAESHVIRGEDPAALAQLAAEYNAEFRPVTPRQRDLVDTLVDNEWKIRRLRAIEAATWEQKFESDIISDDPDTTNRYMILGRKHRLIAAFSGIHKTLDSIQRRLHAYERSTTRALRQLKEISQFAEELASFPQEHPHASPPPKPQSLTPDPQSPTPNPPPLIPAERSEAPSSKCLLFAAYTDAERPCQGCRTIASCPHFSGETNGSEPAPSVGGTCACGTGQPETHRGSDDGEPLV